MSLQATKQAPTPMRGRHTFAELLARWQWTENDLREAILRGQIVPSIYEKEPIWPMRLDSEGKRVRVVPAQFSNRWMFAVGVKSTGPFDCRFDYLANERDALVSGHDVFSRDGSGYVNNRITLSQIIEHGTFEADEVARYEAARDSSNPLTDDKSPGKQKPWWQERHDIKAMAIQIEANWHRQNKPLNQSGSRAGKYSLSALGNAVAAEIGKVESSRKSARTIGGKSVEIALKALGWE